MFRKLLAVILLLSCAACSIVSDKRLIPLGESVFPLPAKALLVSFGEGRDSSTSRITRNGRSYVMPAPQNDGRELKIPVTFFRGPSGFLVAEAEDRSKDRSGFHYALARVEGDVLTLYTIDNAEDLEIFGELTGGRFLQSLKVSSRSNLYGAFSAMIANPDTLMTELGRLKIFDLARKDAEAAAERFAASQGEGSGQ